MLAGASEDHLSDKTRKTETLGELNDKTDNVYNEKEPDKIKMSWRSEEETVELMGELDNVTSRVLCQFLYQYCPTLFSFVRLKFCLQCANMYELYLHAVK